MSLKCEVVYSFMKCVHISRTPHVRYQSACLSINGMSSCYSFVTGTKRRVIDACQSRVIVHQPPRIHHSCQRQIRRRFFCLPNFNHSIIHCKYIFYFGIQCGKLLCNQRVKSIQKCGMILSGIWPKTLYTYYMFDENDNHIKVYMIQMHVILSIMMVLYCIL